MKSFIPAMARRTPRNSRFSKSLQWMAELCLLCSLFTPAILIYRRRRRLWRRKFTEKTFCDQQLDLSFSPVYVSGDDRRFKTEVGSLKKRHPRTDAGAGGEGESFELKTIIRAAVRAS
jgi:hypothetical protein